MSHHAVGSHVRRSGGVLFSYLDPAVRFQPPDGRVAQHALWSGWNSSDDNIYFLRGEGGSTDDGHNGGFWSGDHRSGAGGLFGTKTPQDRPFDGRVSCQCGEQIILGLVNGKLKLIIVQSPAAMALIMSTAAANYRGYTRKVIYGKPKV